MQGVGVFEDDPVIGVKSRCYVGDTRSGCSVAQQAHWCGEGAPTKTPMR